MEINGIMKELPQLEDKPVKQTKTHVGSVIESSDSEDDGVRLSEPSELTSSKQLEDEKYLARRQMTPLQEKWNALTMIPNPIFCWVYLAMGFWICGAPTLSSVTTASSDDITEQCWNSRFLPPTMPPSTMISIAIGITVHAPFSFIYHWWYGAYLSAKERAKHWSRKLDMTFIMIASVFCSYGTSGSVAYTLGNLVMNAYSILKLWSAESRPKAAQARIFVSMIGYTVPVLYHGEVEIFLKAWVVFVISGWFFVKYPVNGWSHAAFHLVISLLPPVLMEAAGRLPSSQERIAIAAQCATMQTETAVVQSVSDLFLPHDHFQLDTLE